MNYSFFPAKLALAAALVVSLVTGTVASALPVLADSGTGTGTATSLMSPALQSATRVGVYTEWTFTIPESTPSVFVRPVWSVASGSLPPGLTLDYSTPPIRTAVIKGIPTTAGTFTVRLHVDTSFDLATAIERSYTLMVHPIEIDPLALPNAMVQAPYTHYLNVLGGISPFSWTILSGRLPAGLYLSTTGIVSGTPLVAETTTFTAQATDASGMTTARALTLVADPDNSLRILTPSLPTGTVGVAYATTLSGTGGSSGYVWTLGLGDLPPGVTLASSGSLSGTPTLAGTYLSKIRLTDASGATLMRAYTVVVNPAGTVPTSPTTSALHISTVSLPNGTVGAWFGYNLGVTGGTAPYTWSRSAGTLPTGLSFDPAGAIYGTASTAGTYTFTASVRDAAGVTTQQAYTVTIQGASSTGSTGSSSTGSSSTGSSSTGSSSTGSSSTGSTGTGTGSAELEMRVRNLDHIGVAVNALVKLPDDGNRLTQEDSAVYFIGTDGRRHAFPNDRVFFTWYAGFDEVRVVQASALASIPLGSNVTYKPGVRMVKFTTNSNVYVVGPGRTLRAIPSEAVAASLYGTNWNRSVDDIADTFYTDYLFGAGLITTADYNPASMRASASVVSDVLPL